MENNLKKKIDALNKLKKYTIYGDKWRIAIWWGCSLLYIVLIFFNFAFITPNYSMVGMYFFLAALFFAIPFINTLDFKIQKNEVDILNNKLQELESKLIK